MLGGEHHTLAGSCDSWIHDRLFSFSLSFSSLMSLEDTLSAKFSAQQMSPINWNLSNFRAFSLHPTSRCYKIWIYKYWINMQQKRWPGECRFATLHSIIWWKVGRIMQPNSVYTVTWLEQVPSPVWKQTGNKSIYSACVTTLHYPLLVDLTHSIL